MSELRPLIQPTRHIIGSRPNMIKLLDGIEQDPSQLEAMLTSFDTAIEDYNSINVSELPDDLTFLPRVKPLLSTLPTTKEMLAAPQTPACRSFVRSLHIMRPLMERAEDRQPEPNVGFHIWDGASVQEHLMGGVFQAYGLTQADLTLGRDVEKDKLYEFRDAILDSLIEIMALNTDSHPDSPIFEAVKSIGWLQAQNEDGTYLFSQIVREASTTALN